MTNIRAKDLAKPIADINRFQDSLEEQSEKAETLLKDAIKRSRKKQEFTSLEKEEASLELRQQQIKKERELLESGISRQSRVSTTPREEMTKLGFDTSDINHKRFN